eukprot:5896277-Amphidinium_carterae.1
MGTSVFKSTAGDSKFLSHVLLEHRLCNANKVWGSCKAPQLGITLGSSSACRGTPQCQLWLVFLFHVMVGTLFLTRALHVARPDVEQARCDHKTASVPCV